jgi:hypothetical protein
MTAIYRSSIDNQSSTRIELRNSPAMSRRLLLTIALLAGSLAFSPALPSAQACPMCKLANEEGGDTQAAAVANARPRAYMYSILFMLSMPAVLTAAFALGFYRLHKLQQALQATEGAAPVLAEPAPA